MDKNVESRKNNVYKNLRYPSHRTENPVSISVHNKNLT